MKISKQKWVVGTLTLSQGEVEIINEESRDRIAIITIADFKSVKEAKKIAEAIASLPELLREKK